MSEITQMITSLGFPIVMCLIACYYIKYILDKYSEQIEKITLEHKREVSELTKTIENNTLAITKLVEKMGDE